MATFRVEKVVASPPANPQPNTLYLVRVGTGFDFYVSDALGQISHKINGGTGGPGSLDWLTEEW